MKLSDLIEDSQNKIDPKDLNILLSDLLNINPLTINMLLDREISKSNYAKYQRAVKKLQNNIPIQYVLGKWNFYGYEFFVNKNVLIPRFTTEELVENTLVYIDQYFKRAKCLDLCTGSGCIGITLYKERNNLDITMSDINDEALKIAKKNAKRLKAKVDLIKSDLLKDIDNRFDIIISNPPYLSPNDNIDDIVKENEPSLALYGGEDGLFYYRKILSTVKKNLNDRYLIALEIGDNLSDQIIELVNNYLDDVKIIIKKDLSGQNRMLFILKNLE